MLLLIDNYDSFTYNLYQYLCELGAEVEVVRNDTAGIDELIAMAPERVVVSPGPSTPMNAGVSIEAIRHFGQHVPVLGTIESPGTVEAGDCVWLDAKTLLVGLGFRTNQSGMAQLQEILGPHQVDIHSFDLPVYHGDATCLHLMSIISMVADDLAVVYEPLLPVLFWRLLRHRGIEIVPVPHEEFATQGPNVLALAPRRCVMLEDNTKTQARLEAAGCEVLTYRGRELSLKAEGGATCLTRPVLRSAP